MAQPCGYTAPPLTILLPAFVALLLWTTPALGAGKASAVRKAQENAARKACLSGDYAKGVEILSDLFVSTKNPTYIFNQGRCFEQNRRYEDAISRFHEYLNVGTDEAESDRSAAKARIADCREMLAQERAVLPEPVPPQPPQPAPPPTESPASPEPASVAVVASPPPPPPVSAASGRGLRIGGIVVASVGAAAGAAGLLFNLKSNSLVTDMESTNDGYTKESERKTWRAASIAAYGVGAACLATGAILYTVGLRKNAGLSNGVAAMPTVGPNHAGIALTGAF